MTYSSQLDTSNYFPTQDHSESSSHFPPAASPALHLGCIIIKASSVICLLMPLVFCGLPSTKRSR